MEDAETGEGGTEGWKSGTCLSLDTIEVPVEEWEVTTTQGGGRDMVRGDSRYFIALSKKIADYVGADDRVSYEEMPLG